HDTLPMLTFYSKAFSASQLLAKRCLDIAGALIGLLLLGLMLPLVGLAIKLESPGPIFFGQLRLGEQGRPFRCWKLRSMVVDAEQRKQGLIAHNEMQGQMFKIKDDPRVTRVGRFIRKTSIDEFPQFWNVLKGEMSLVGTRPPTPDEVANYEDWHHKRISIRPGITGLWQVSGRNQIQDFDEVARLDIRYVENWSIWLDIKILCQTLWVVTLGRGAS
ncbi:MAG: exopolysaccharide biosynthesis polyprenyl glycosylphosphotransferase, partial [Trichlorobacter sp.]